MGLAPGGLVTEAAPPLSASVVRLLTSPLLAKVTVRAQIAMVPSARNNFVVLTCVFTEVPPSALLVCTRSDADKFASSDFEGLRCTRFYIPPVNR